MTSLYRILTIEYLRRLRFPWFLGVVVFIGGPLAILGLFALKDPKLSYGWMGPYDNLINFTAISLCILSLLTLLVQWQVYPHLYSRPISTRAMAGWLMVTGVVTLAGTNLLYLLAYRVMLGAAWPILAPTLFFATFTLIAQCINWHWLKLTCFKLAGGLAVIVGSLWWFAQRYYPAGFKKPMVPWFIPSAEELGIMLAACVAAVVLGIRGLSNARHEGGGSVSSNSIDDAADPYVRSRVPNLSEIPQALNWFFWQRGMPYAVGAAGMLAFFMGLVFVVFPDIRPKSGEVLGSITGMSLLIPPLTCALIGVALGMDVRHQVQYILMPFLSTRPVTTKQLSRGLLVNAFKCTLTAWGILVLAFVLCSTEFFVKTSPGELLSELQASKLGIASGPLALGGSLLMCWIGLSWMAVLGWSGREKVLIAGMFLVVVFPILFLVSVQFLQPRGLEDFVRRVGLCIPAILIPVATIDMTIAAWRAKFLSQETLILMAALAVVIIGVAVVLPPAEEPAEKILLCLYSMAALLPIPLTPLMLAWNRHR